MHAAVGVNPVPYAGQSDPRDVREAVALSLLRRHADTAAARALKELTQPVRTGDAPAGGLMFRLATALGLGPDPSRHIERARELADESMARATRQGLLVIPWDDPRYPRPLWEIYDPPIVLWLQGAAECLTGPSVAVVGSRRATPAGLAIARHLGQGLASAGLVVVSGLARGIDGAAHEGALDAGGRTVAVLGSGPDVIYPREHRHLSERVIDQGLLVSEFPPGTAPLPGHFPLRNRLISGLCRAVVVIEASEKSGSLITARMALEQGREVLAVPGNVASGRNAGGHALIKDGAGLVESTEDVLQAIGWSAAAEKAASDHDKPSAISILESHMAAGEVYTVDDLAARIRLDSPALLAELGALEAAGRITRVEGGGFLRLDKSAIG